MALATAGAHRLGSHGSSPAATATVFQASGDTLLPPVKLHISASLNRHSQTSKRMIISTKTLNFSHIIEASTPESRRHTGTKKWVRLSSATDSDKITSDVDSVNAKVDDSGKQLPSANVEPNLDSPNTNGNAQGAPKRAPMTAREKIRAARVLSRYTDSKPSKSVAGSKVLDALRESDGGKKRSGLPEAPSNLFDDSKRGMPKSGLTFTFPGGTDLFIIVSSFIFITTVMFATTYIVWKVGAIHFNE